MPVDQVVPWEYHSIGGSRQYRQRGRILEPMNTKPARPRRYHPGSPFQAPPEQTVEEFAVDDRVTHDKHGLGRVVAAGSDAVIVDFGSHQVRVPTPFTKLTKL